MGLTKRKQSGRQESDLGVGICGKKKVLEAKAYLKQSQNIL